MPKKIRIITMQMYAERLGVPYQNIRHAYRLYTNQEANARPWIRRLARAMAPPNAVIGRTPLWLSTEIEEFEKDNPPEQILNENTRGWRYGTDEALYLVDEKRLEAVARKVLQGRELDLFLHRYRLGGHPFLTHKQAAEKYSVQRSRIGQIQHSAERKVRQALGMDDA